MKKIAIILVCMLTCFSLFIGCTDQKNGGDQDTNVGNSVEIDDTDIDVDAETKPGEQIGEKLFALLTTGGHPGGRAGHRRMAGRHPGLCPA
ncbi:MAG: hypothetical protein HFI97_04135 [Lachnospiraceae bacterium]|nr:hypothetical protein [Lachnospiraceae bacterium]